MFAKRVILTSNSISNTRASITPWSDLGQLAEKELSSSAARQISTNGMCRILFPITSSVTPEVSAISGFVAQTNSKLLRSNPKEITNYPLELSKTHFSITGNTHNPKVAAASSANATVGPAHKATENYSFKLRFRTKERSKTSQKKS